MDSDARRLTKEDRLLAENSLLRDALSDLIGPAEASTWTLDTQEPDERLIWEATWTAIEAARNLLKETP